MHDGELWQAYYQNGHPLSGGGFTDDAFDESSLVMGNAHVWLWRSVSDRPEILLQKRALTKTRAPGYYHISAGGHINAGESPIEAAIRETKEELGIDLDPADLYFVGVSRTPRNWNDLAHVFTYRVDGREEFSFDDGEVDGVDWHPLERFYEMAQNPEEYQLINQGMLYFEPLYQAISRQHHA